MTDELEAIAPSQREVAYAGERLVVQPLTVGQIPEVVRRTRSVINSVLDIEALDGESDAEHLVDIALDLVEKHGDALFEAAALMVAADPALVKRGSIEEFIDLARAIYEVNADFFVRRLAPKVAEWRASRSAGAGKTPSTPSSAPATG